MALLPTLSPALAPTTPLVATVMVLTSVLNGTQVAAPRPPFQLGLLITNALFDGNRVRPPLDRLSPAVPTRLLPDDTRPVMAVTPSNEVKAPEEFFQSEP